ncbi:ParB/RepB/Spo0J family partition protein [Streptomyces sp. MN03-5084-2B]|nr:ParB/RepB/Spo0J family partition protein [Streptomyces sp. MN03-5084-2B]
MNTDTLPSAAADRPAAADWNPRLSAVEIVPLASLLPGESPRAAGENAEHAKLLASAESVLPPITVHRATRRVIDGRHRLAAAVVRGDDVIRVRFFDGDERDAFVLSVRENTAHGLPLSSRDRAAAADRILRTHPSWSDRAIAEIAGLSAKTVAGLRRALAGEAQPAARLGRDGKVRPLSTAAGRARARRLLEEMPGASLRSIAELAGISPGTVRDVRNRMLRGEGPVPGGAARPAKAAEPNGEGSPERGARPWAAEPAVAPAPPEVPAARRGDSPVPALDALMNDPSLKFSEQGRFLLRLLSANARAVQHRVELTEVVPAHCLPLIGEVARAYAKAWLRLADEFERKRVAGPSV